MRIDRIVRKKIDRRAVPDFIDDGNIFAVEGVL